MMTMITMITQHKWADERKTEDQKEVQDSKYLR